MTTILRLRRFTLTLILVAMGLAATAEEALASHFRYGSISWRVNNPAQPTTVTIRLDSVWRWDFQWQAGAPGNGGPVWPGGPNPPVGYVVGTLSNFANEPYMLDIYNSAHTFLLTSIPIYPLVTSTNAAEDWMATTFEKSITLGAGDFIVELRDAARLSTLLEGNDDQLFMLQAGIQLRVSPQIPNRAPVGATLPIIRVPRGANTQFLISAYDPDGDPIVFFPTAAAQSGLVTPVPAGLNLASNGLVSYFANTLGLRAFQVTVRDNRGAFTVIDLLLDVVNSTSTSPPNILIDGTPTFKVFSVVRGTPLSFTVSGVDPLKTITTLTSSPLPVGASMSPSLPTSSAAGNVSSTFTWTPAPTQLGTYVVSYAATNGAGLQRQAGATINVTNLAPTITSCTPSSGPDGTIEAVGPLGVPFSLTASIDDDDNDKLAFSLIIDGHASFTLGNITPPMTVATPPTGPWGLGAHTYSATVSDGFSPAQTCNGSFTIVDTTAPSVSVPADLTLTATSPASSPTSAVYAFTATATDLVDPSPAIACLPPSGSAFVIGDTVVTCTATDGSGNANSASFTVTVTDSTPPVVTPTITGTLGNNGWYLSDVTVAWATSDPESGIASSAGCATVVTTTDTAGVTLTCTATNGSGQTTAANALFVRDATAPKVTISVTPINQEASSPSGAVATYDPPTATDSLSGVGGDVTCTSASGSTFPIGTTIVTCSAADKAGNIGAAEIEIIVSDTIAPAIGTLPDVLAEATSASGAGVAYPMPSVIDAGDAHPKITCEPASGSTFALGATLVTCIATDHTRNSSTRTMTVKVSDTTPPAIAPLSNLDLAGSDPSGAAATWDVSATDAVSAVTIDCTPPSGSTFPYGTTNVVCKASDAAQNTASASFTVMVTDATPPVIVGTAAGTLGLNGWYTSSVQVTWSITDGQSSIANTSGCDGTTTSTNGASFSFTCTATSEGGTSSQTVTFMRDATAPAITVPGDLTVGATTASGSVVNYLTSASDAPAGVSAFSCLPVSGSLFPVGASTVACTATDNAGNTSTGSFTVTVTDPTPPVITPTVAGTLGANGWYTSDVTVSWTVTDPDSGITSSTGCTTSTTTTDGASFTKTCTATSAGGTSTQSVTFKRDASAPTITVSPNQTDDADSWDGTDVTYAAAAAADPTSGIASVVCAPPSGSTFPIGVTTVSCVATNNAGLTRAGTFTVTIVDRGEPGKMYGAGETPGPDSHKIEFNFSVFENRRGNEWGDVKIKVRDTRRRRGDDERFDARTVDDVFFSNAPDYGPGHNSRTGIDTVVFRGTGKWDGHSGYTYVVTASDRGEPGRGRDTFSIEIKSPTGAVVFTGGGTLSDGNVQSSRLNRSWNWWNGHHDSHWDNRGRGRDR
ncbi:MAG: HYR domain-containing protein [Vicinamibacterales bacterium]